MSVYGSRLYSTLYCIFQHITVFPGFGAFCVHPEGHGLFEAGHNTAALPVEIYCSSRRCRSILFLTRPVWDVPGVHHEQQMALPRRTRGAADAHDAGPGGRTS